MQIFRIFINRFGSNFIALFPEGHRRASPRDWQLAPNFIAQWERVAFSGRYRRLACGIGSGRRFYRKGDEWYYLMGVVRALLGCSSSKRNSIARGLFFLALGTRSFGG